MPTCAVVFVLRLIALHFVETKLTISWTFYSYGGPGSQLVTDLWKMDMNHVLASGKSFIVLEIDGAGTGGQGEGNKMAVKGKLGQLEVQDQLDAIR